MSLVIEMTSYCCICLCTDKDECAFKTLECCGNRIHTDCYLEWILHKGWEASCPICRQSIQFDRIPLQMYNQYVVNQSSLTLQQQRHLQFMRTEYEIEAFHYIMLYFSILLGISILLCFVVSFV